MGVFKREMGSQGHALSLLGHDLAPLCFSLRSIKQSPLRGQPRVAQISMPSRWLSALQGRFSCAAVSKCLSVCCEVMKVEPSNTYVLGKHITPKPCSQTLVLLYSLRLA